MPQQWKTESTPSVTDEPQIHDIKSEDTSRIVGRPRKPHLARKKRKAMWVYLSDREREAVAEKAIEAGETMSEWIRNAVRKATKC